MTIVAAIDFSEGHEEIARIAVKAAHRFGGRVVLVHAVEPVSAAYGGVVPVSLDIAPLVDSGQALMHRLSDALATTGTTPAVTIETRVVVGSPDQVVEDIARETTADLIVAGTHGRGAVGRLLIGSVAQRLLLRVPCAVLVVRRDGAASFETWLEGKRALRIVVGVDRGGRSTDAAMDWVRKLRGFGPCEVTLVHDYWPPAEYARFGMRGPRNPFETDPEISHLIERDLSASLGGLAQSPDVKLRARAAWGSMGEALAREAATERADLVLVGSEQPHGWERIKRPSVAISALHAVTIPLLCVPESTHAVRPRETPPVPALWSVMAATDLSDAGNAVVAHALSLLRGGGVIHLVHVREHELPSPAYAYAPVEGMLTPAKRAEMEERLRELIPSNAARSGVTVNVSVIDGGHAAEQLASAAHRLGVDAVVIASHGRSGFKRAVLGSVAEAVVRTSEIPVYVVRAPVLHR